MTTAVGPTDSTVRRPALERTNAMRLAATEYDRFADLIRTLSAGDWTRPTACPAWDVRALASHVLGMAEMVASPVEQVRQMTKAKRAGGLFIDALTAVQVAKHAGRTPDELVERAGAIGPKAARGRRRTPGLMRKAKMKDQPINETGTTTETWALGYLVDVILTRDTWMHRSDIARATDRPMVLTADHDAVLVADVAGADARRGGVLPGAVRPRHRRGPAGDAGALLGSCGRDRRRWPRCPVRGQPKAGGMHVGADLQVHLVDVSAPDACRAGSVRRRSGFGNAPSDASGPANRATIDASVRGGCTARGRTGAAGGPVSPGAHDE